MPLYCHIVSIFNLNFQLSAASTGGRSAKKSALHARALENGKLANNKDKWKTEYSSTTANPCTCKTFKRLHIIIYLANFNHLLRNRVITALPRIIDVQN